MAGVMEELMRHETARVYRNAVDEVRRELVLDFNVRAAKALIKVEKFTNDEVASICDLPFAKVRELMARELIGRCQLSLEEISRASELPLEEVRALAAK